MHRYLFALLVFLLNATTAHGHGDEAHPPQHQHSEGTAQRTIVVEMRDSYEFSPSQITVRVGETVRFIPVNVGKHMHEMIIGTMKELQDHHETMKSNPGMHHDPAHMAHVAPGKSGVIVWQPSQPGEFYFGCLVDDHFDAGMIGRIQVVAAEGSEHRHEGHSTGHAPPSEMPAAFGGYSMTRESSGTSWQPDASPHQGIHAVYGEWTTMTHGFANLIYDRQGGPRGDKKTFSTSMLMLMAQRPLGQGTLGLRGMVSADPLMGKRGYPLLLQTGEAANGAPLIDRQHPHDLFMELAASYSHPLSERSSVFAYVGLPGEPALGPPAFMHRFSGEDNPEAPISHHWLDSTHITYGVVTLGYVYGNAKIEGSVFRGREPDESRYNIETGKLDSASVRVSYNPTRNWALQMSRGHIKSPEELHPDMDINRTTASAIYHRPFGNAIMQVTAAWGRNAPNHGEATNTFLLESALRLSRTHTFFARAERADKDELFLSTDALAHERFRVGKLSVGYVRDFPRDGGYTFGLGGLVSRYSLPGELEPVYGDPTSFMLFARVKIL